MSNSIYWYPNSSVHLSRSYQCVFHLDYIWRHQKSKFEMVLKFRWFSEITGSINNFTYVTAVAILSSNLVTKSVSQIWNKNKANKMVISSISTPKVLCKNWSVWSQRYLNICQSTSWKRCMLEVIHLLWVIWSSDLSYKTYHLHPTQVESVKINCQSWALQIVESMLSPNLSINLHSRKCCASAIKVCLKL